MSIGQIRKAVQSALLESSSDWASPPAPAGRSSRHQSINAYSREPIERQSIQNIKNDELDDIADHLKDEDDPDEDPYGPVPPIADNPYVMQDPFVRNYSPNPSPMIYR